MLFDRNTEFVVSGRFAGFSAVDFWEWYGANCLDGSVRGSLAEYVIMRSLGIQCSRKSWAAYDLDYLGYRIEVKSTSLFTSKNGQDVRQYVGNQRLVFGIEPKHIHVSGGDWTTRKRNSDLYVFALLDSPDAALLDAWRFYPALTSVLDDTFPEQKTISLTAIEKAGFQECTYSTLRPTIDNLLFGGNEMNDEKKPTICVGSKDEERDLQRLIACYQAANAADKENVWSALKKYLNEPNLK